MTDSKPIRPSGVDRIVFDTPFFGAYCVPHGFLCATDDACHALMYYAVNARRAYEENELGFGVQYDDPNILWNKSNFRQLWETICIVYGIPESAMVRHWPCVDMQCRVLNIPQLPDEERYRFNRPIKLESV